MNSRKLDLLNEILLLKEMHGYFEVYFNGEK